MSTPVPCLIGPTGSGKSDVAVAAVRAAGRPAEVISCDAYAVYRGMPILTAAPDAPSDVPHHLVGILAPDDTYDAARFLTDADDHIARARKRGATPWIVGGTALYLRGWLKGFGAAAPADPAYRSQLRALVAARGPEALHDRLAALDPVRAKALHPNDVRRVGRALEIIRSTGRPASDQRMDWSGPDRVPATVIGLRRPFEDLDARIEQRTRAMFEAGVVDEVKTLLQGPLSPQASQALGLQEVRDVLAGSMDEAEAMDRMAQRTRRFARKQMTFFRSFDRVTWVDAAADDTPEDLGARVASTLG